MIHSITEGEIRWLPGLALQDLPFPMPIGITVHAKRELLGLEAQGIAGSIPMSNGATLHIRPKIGQVNFLRMLFLAEGAQADLQREYEQFVDYYVDDDEALNSLVARHLMVSASQILHQSPMIGRVNRTNRGAFALGRVDALKTAVNIASRQDEPVAYNLKVRTKDIAENRVISEAIIRAAVLLSETDFEKYKPIFYKWISRFPRSKDIADDLQTVEEGFASSKYGGPRGYYQKALMLSQIFLGSMGMGLGEASVIQGDAVLLSTADIFERYLRNAIANAYAKDGYIVTKGGGAKQSLYTDGSYEIDPDIVVSREGKTVLIADAKYKRPTSSDHYQMNSYLSTFGISSGVLLAPLYQGSEVVTKDYATGRGAFVREVYLPMDDLRATEAFLGTLVERYS